LSRGVAPELQLAATMHTRMGSDNLFDQRSTGAHHAGDEYRLCGVGAAIAGRREGAARIDTDRVVHESGALGWRIGHWGGLLQLIGLPIAVESLVVLSEVIPVLADRKAQVGLLERGELAGGNLLNALQPIGIGRRHFSQSR